MFGGSVYFDNELDYKSYNKIKNEGKNIICR